MARKRLGELLLEHKVISRAQLDAGLAHQRTTRQRLGVVLIQKGFLTEEQLSNALSEALAIPQVDLKTVQPEWEAIHLLRPRFCESNHLFPYKLEVGRGGRKLLSVALSDPLNLTAIDEIEFTNGVKVVPRIAPLSAIRVAILRHYHRIHTDDSPRGKMTVIHSGGGSRIVDTETPDPLDSVEVEEVIEGEPVGEVTERAALEDLIARRQAQRRQRRTKTPAPQALFGLVEGADGLEQLEEKFWALMRIMARKGLITQEEFTQELDRDQEDPPTS